MKKTLTVILSFILIMAVILPASAFSTIAVKGIKLDKSKISLKIGQTYTLKVTLTPKNTTQKILSYTIDNKKIATIDGTGKIKGVGAGTTTLTVYTSNKKIFAKCSVTVVAEAPIRITVKPQNQGPQDNNNPVTAAINKKFNVKIEYIYLDRNKETDLLNMKIASGEIPDVMLLQSNQYSAYAVQGALAELKEDVFKKYAPKLYQITKTNSEDLIYQHYSINGKLWGIPMLTPDGNVGYVNVWRGDWLKNVGIKKVPETIDEAEAAFYKFVRNDPDKDGKNDTYAFSDKGISAIFNSFGCSPTSFSTGSSGGSYWQVKDGKIVYDAVRPEMKDALTLLIKWYKDGLIDPEFITGENKGQYGANSVTFWNGKIGFTAPGVYYHVNPPLFEGDLGSANYQNFKQLQPNGDYVVAQPFKGPSGKMLTRKWSAVTGAAMSMGRQVANDSRKMEKILELYEAMCTDNSVRELFWNGIDGVTFKERDKYGFPKYSDEWNKDPQNGLRYALGINGMCFINNNFDQFQITKEMLDFKNKYSKCASGFLNAVWSGLPSDGQYKAVVDKKVQQAYAEFITGQRSLSEWDKFVDDVYAAGLTQLTKEANEWYYGK